MSVNGILKRPRIDRRLFVAAAIVFPLIVLAGFSRTYYLKTFFHTPPLASMLVHMHGILMTSWVLLFISQVWLISSKRVRTHQRMGFSAIGLAVLIVVVGFFVAVRAAKFGAASTPPGVSRLSFLIVPLTDLFNFAVLFSAAIYLRKKASHHKRLMLLTAINFLPPAVARIPITSLQALGPLWFFGFPAGLALIALTVDSWQNRKINKWFLAGTLFLISSFVLRLVLMGTGAWIFFAGWLTSWAA
jgi:hypothetical protein